MCLTTIAQLLIPIKGRINIHEVMVHALFESASSHALDVHVQQTPQGLRCTQTQSIKEDNNDVSISSIAGNFSVGVYS